MPLPLYKETTPPSKVLPRSIIAVAAGKGGVGKSTVAVGLALALKQRGNRVGLLDADLYGPSIPHLLPESRPPAKKDKMILPADCCGVSVMSMAYFRAAGEAAAVRAPIANKVIGEFISSVEWGDLDILVLDCPPGTGDIHLTLSQQIPIHGAVLVTTPQEVSLLDVRRAAHLFQQMRVPILGIAENMSYLAIEGKPLLYPFGRGGGERLAGELNLPLLTQIPLEPLLCTCGDAGRSPFDEPQLKGSAAIRAFETLAAEVSARLQQLAAAQPDSLKQFSQKDAHTFELVWNDGLTGEFRLSELQKRCPCAGCVDEGTGMRREIAVDPQVRATTIQPVGHYGLRIQFTSGCSNGIYAFEELRKMARKEK